MIDNYSTEDRHAIMRKIGPKDSAPELFIRSLVHRMGHRFRLHVRNLPGAPDIVLPRYRKIIFMHSCFFPGHKGCRRATIPKTRREFWQNKIKGNASRDKRQIRELRYLGWDVMVIWQCQIKKSNEDRLRIRISKFMEH